MSAAEKRAGQFDPPPDVESIREWLRKYAEWVGVGFDWLLRQQIGDMLPAIERMFREWPEPLSLKPRLPDTHPSPPLGLSGHIMCGTESAPPSTAMITEEQFAAEINRAASMKPDALLADLLGVSRPTINRWMGGTNLPGTAMRKAIFKFLRVWANEPSPLSAAPLFKTGDFRLHSGEQSNFKIDCDALTDSDWESLAYMVADRVGKFSSVEGVPQGGLKLAEKLRSQVWSEGPILIVDDVLTTGDSMEQQRAGRDAIGAVIFARSQPPSWVTPLFTLAPQPTPNAEEEKQ